MGTIATFDQEQRDSHTELFKGLYITQTGFQAFVGITTIAVPADIFPSTVRGTCHGISAVMGKFGAIFGSYYFAMVSGDDYSGIMSAHPIQYIFLVVTLACIAGVIVTIVLTPKYNGPQLEAMDKMVEVDNHKAALACLYGKGDKQGNLIDNGSDGADA